MTAILEDATGQIQEPLQMASRESALYSSQPPFPLVISSFSENLDFKLTLPSSRN